MSKSIKKYGWLLLSLVILIAVIYYSGHTFKTLNNKRTTEAIVKLDQMVKSQDKAVEKIYSGVKKGVSAKNAEIRRAVKVLSPDTIAVSLDALLNEYRRERDSGD